MNSKLCFVGDLCLAGHSSEINDLFSATWHRWRHLTDQVDMTVANLESCIIENGHECDRFMATPESACDIISKLRIDVCSLANNHVMDCGYSGLDFMQRCLHEKGVQTVGAGRNIEEAATPLIVSKNDALIGIIATTDATHYKAKRNQAGISPLSLNQMEKAIKRIIDTVDLVVLCIHSDLEFTNYPAPWKVRMSRKLARAGADIIIHHHPHTLQGIEIYEGTLIAYSLGNFIFPVHGLEYMENRDGHVNESIILKVNVESTTRGKNSISYKLIPIVIDKDNVTQFAEGDQAENIIAKMSHYSDKLHSMKHLRKHYFQACLAQARRFLMGTYYTLDKDGLAAAYKYMKTHVTTKMHRNWMRGALTQGRL